jgi:hypothetical protein
MAQPCSICQSPQRAEIERAMLSRSLRDIARQFQVSKDAALRHKQHISTALAKSLEARDMTHGGVLAAELQVLIAEAHRLKDMAEKKRDIRTALMAIRELTRLLELTAKLTGELDERAHHNELHVHLPPDRALAVARTYLERHGASGGSPGSMVTEGGQGELIQPSGTAAVSTINEENNANETGT